MPLAHTFSHNVILCFNDRNVELEVVKVECRISIVDCITCRDTVGQYL